MYVNGDRRPVAARALGQGRSAAAGGRAAGPRRDRRGDAPRDRGAAARAAGRASEARAHVEQAPALAGSSGCRASSRPRFARAAATLAFAEHDPGAARGHATARARRSEGVVHAVLQWLGVRAAADPAVAARAHRRAMKRRPRRRLLADPRSPGEEWRRRARLSGARARPSTRAPTAPVAGALGGRSRAPSSSLE